MITSDTSPRVDIIIPTHNRAHLIETAVRAALDQSWYNKCITVVDDASSDATQDVLRPFFDRPDFTYIRLARNVGTAGAKNAGLLLTNGAAVTFHDSDDIPHRDKVLRQVRVLTRQDVAADECLNWALAGQIPGAKLQIGAVLTYHDLLLPDGRRVLISRTLSLVDDVFPNLQMGSDVPGDWTHVNSGLFAHDIFARQGGFECCIEEDREFRNRLVLNGEVIWVIPDPLLTKIETPGSLTQAASTDYDSTRRRADRHMVWRRVDEWRRTGRITPVEVDLPDLEMTFCSAPNRLARRAIAMTSATRAQLARIQCRADNSIEAAE